MSQSLCLDCTEGKYAASEESLSCTTCANGYDSLDGASDCILAALDYYLVPSKFKYNESHTAASCPQHMNCAGGKHAPAPEKGYWVDRSSYEFVKDVYPCPRRTCTGSKSTDSCWTADNITTDVESGPCEENTLLCMEGSRGPLCGSCETHYIFKPISRVCEPCDRAVKWTFVTAIVGGTIFVH